MKVYRGLKIDSMKEKLILLRNVFCIIYTWLSLLLILIKGIMKETIISIPLLFMLLLVSLFTAIIFVISFSDGVIKKWGFKARLTLFMASIVIIELVLFYSLKIIRTSTQIFLFGGIVIVLYGACLVIFHFYSKKKNKQYDSILSQYQIQRKEVKNDE